MSFEIRELPKAKGLHNLSVSSNLKQIDFADDFLTEPSRSHRCVRLDEFK